MLPQETLFEILANLRRRDLDALELVNRALGSLIAAKFDDAPSRVISLMFYEDEHVMLTCPSEGWRRVPIIELPQYVSRAVIPKMLFKPLSSSAHSFTEEMYQGEEAISEHSCRATLVSPVCEFRSLSVFAPNILHKAFTEVLMCNTMVFQESIHFVLPGEQQLALLPCLANCANLQIARYVEAFFDANSALEWLLGTHAVTTGEKRLFIGVIAAQHWEIFLTAFIVAVEEQFTQATTPASFHVELFYLVRWDGTGPNIGRTRAHKNTDTNEQLKVGVRNPNGERDSMTKVTIRRRPIA